MHCLNFAGMQIKARHTFRIIAHCKENSQTALIDLLINQELGKPPIDLVLRRSAVRAEQVGFGTNRLVKRTLRLCRLCRFGITQLELLDPALDSSEDCEQMKLLLH